jgi:hypothetical protein
MKRLRKRTKANLTNTSCNLPTWKRRASRRHGQRLGRRPIYCRWHGTAMPTNTGTHPALQIGSIRPGIAGILAGTNDVFRYAIAVRNRRWYHNLVSQYDTNVLYYGTTFSTNLSIDICCLLTSKHKLNTMKPTVSYRQSSRGVEFDVSKGEEVVTSQLEGANKMSCCRRHSRPVDSSGSPTPAR